MQNSKKIVIFTLSILALTGWVYVFRDSALFDGLSSNALNTSFTCTESSLKAESAAYRQTKIRYKKALAIQKNLESEIAQMMVTKSEELQKKQDALKILKRQIMVYTRFVKKYDTCTREVHLQPIVSPGLMSGEAKIVPSLPGAYQELVGFEISSPENLDTFLNTIQFHVQITPPQGIVVDQWFLVSDLSAPSPCDSSPSGDSITIDCDMLGGIPSSIPSTTKHTYRLWAHIISVDQTVEGRIEASVVWMTFNDGREGFSNKTMTSILPYGVVPVIPPVVSPPEIIVPTEDTITPPPVTPPPATTPIIPEIPPVVIPPEPEALASDTSVSGALPPVAETSTPPADDDTSILSPTDDPSSGTDDIETPPVPPEVPPASESNTSTSGVVAE